MYLFLNKGTKMNTLKKKFGKRIKELRRSLKLTQEQIAQMIDIEPPNISKMESGLHFPQPENIEKLANALNVEVKDLFDFEHITSREMLKTNIIENLNTLNDKELQYIYKVVNGIKELH